MLASFIIGCIVYFIIGIGTAKSMTRAGWADDMDSRVFATVLWPLFLICTTLFADWSE